MSGNLVQTKYTYCQFYWESIILYQSTPILHAKGSLIKIKINIFCFYSRQSLFCWSAVSSIPSQSPKGLKNRRVSSKKRIHCSLDTLNAPICCNLFNTDYIIMRLRWSHWMPSWCSHRPHIAAITCNDLYYTDWTQGHALTLKPLDAMLPLS